jgi:hypothetical protein
MLEPDNRKGPTSREDVGPCLQREDSSMPPESTIDPITIALADGIRRVSSWPRTKPYHNRFRCLDCNALLVKADDDNHHRGCVGQDIAEALRILEARERNV